MPIDSKLQLTREEMRRFGYRVIDRLVDHFDSLPAKPVMHMSSRGEMEARLREPLPEQPSELDSLLERLDRDVWSNIGSVGHPRFFAFVPSPNNFVSVMADALVSGFNPFAGTWLEGSGAAGIEIVTLDWLRDICGMPESAGGLFVSGGSMANLTALAAARHVKLGEDFREAVIYFSDQTHSCVERAARVLGFGGDRIRKIASDDNYRLPLDSLIDAVTRDRAAGLRPFCIVANAGTTNTAAVDPLNNLAEYCRAEDLWFHIDGAYGAAAAMSRRGRELLEGIGLADSLVLDPHKWLFQPYEIGCVLMKDARLLKQTFHIIPEYMKDVQRANEEVNFCDYGIQLTRSFRALKLWMSLKAFGAAAFRQAIETGLELAEKAESYLRASGQWEIITPASLAVVSFRYAPPNSSEIEKDEINSRLVEAQTRDGFCLATSTRLKNRIALRFCTINPRTTPEDIRLSIEKLEEFGRQIYSEVRER